VPAPLTEAVEKPNPPPRDQWTPRAAYELLAQYDGALSVCNSRLAAVRAWGSAK
jgi:hypothetical protein